MAALDPPYPQQQPNPASPNAPIPRQILGVQIDPRGADPLDELLGTSTLGEATLENGDTFRVMRRVDAGAAWPQVRGDNFRGDPNWMNDLFGTGAESLGYRRIEGDALVLAPTTRTLNRRLDRLGEVSGEKVSLRFYDPAAADLPAHVTAEEYVRRYGYDGELPKSATTKEAMHDDYYHVAAIAIPEAAHQQLRAQARAVADFAEYLRSRRLRRAARELIESESRRIDAVTASVMLGRNENFPRSFRGPPEVDPLEFWANRANFRATPAEHLRSISYADAAQHVDEFIQNSSSPGLHSALDWSHQRFASELDLRLERINRLLAEMVPVAH